MIFGSTLVAKRDDKGSTGSGTNAVSSHNTSPETMRRLPNVTGSSTGKKGTGPVAGSIAIDSSTRPGTAAVDTHDTQKIQRQRVVKVLANRLDQLCTAANRQSDGLSSQRIFDGYGIKIDRDEAGTVTVKMAHGMPASGGVLPAMRCASCGASIGQGETACNYCDSPRIPAEA